MKILIITNKEDFHPNSVIDLLRKGKFPFFRLNTEALMTDYDFAWKYEEGNLNNLPDFYIKDRNNGNVIWGHEVYSIWYRRPQIPEEMPFNVEQEIDKHNKEESKQFYFYLMYYLSNIYSIGNHMYDKYANSKLVQLKIALDLGMKIPSTCISNTQKDILDFSRNFPYVILKPLSNFNVLSNNNKIHYLYTTKIQSQKFLEIPEESYSQTVSFCENYIEKKYEVRVTVMGKHIFSCKLDSQMQEDNTGKIDWRQGYEYNLRHSLMSLPPGIECFCREYLKRLNLNFGCFDFIVMPNDDYVFLECNPNGQWGWIEDELKIPMSEAIVDCLVNRLSV